MLTKIKSFTEDIHLSLKLRTISNDASLLDPFVKRISTSDLVYLDKAFNQKGLHQEIILMYLNNKIGARHLILISKTDLAVIYHEYYSDKKTAEHKADIDFTKNTLFEITGKTLESLFIDPIFEKIPQSFLSGSDTIIPYIEETARNELLIYPVYLPEEKDTDIYSQLWGYWLIVKHNPVLDLSSLQNTRRLLKFCARALLLN